MKKFLLFIFTALVSIIVTPVYGQVNQRKMESQGEVLKAKEVIAREVEEEKVFDVVEQMPEFQGGPQALFTWLSQNVKYPAIAEENGVEGRVIVTFVVERDGSIADVRVVKSVDPSLDKEAVRVVKSMPRWIPGKHKGSAVRVKYTVPVTFKLSGEAEIERMKNNQNVAVKKRTTEFPKFPGGKEAQNEWILKNLKYPKESKNLKQFTVAMNCYVEVDGSLTDVRVASRGLHDDGIDPAFGKEAIRVIESMPRWIPGQINGKNVRMQTKIFVTFTPPGSVVNANAKKANTTPQKVSDARLKQQKEDGKIASFTFEDEADGEVQKAKEVIAPKVGNSSYLSELQNIILKSKKEIDSIGTEYAILKRSLNLADDDISTGNKKYGGFGMVTSGKKKYRYDLSYDDLSSYAPLNRSVVRVVANDVFGEVVNVDNLSILLVTYYLQKNFDKISKIVIKTNKMNGNIKYEQGLRRFNDVLLCADISIKDDYLKITRNRGLLYDKANGKVLELTDVLTSSAIKKYELPQKPVDVSIKLKDDSLILTNYEKQPYNTVVLNVNTNKEDLTSGFNNMLSEGDTQALKVKRLQALADKYKMLKNKIELCQTAVNRMKNNQNEEKVFDVVEQMPEFPGGPQALFTWLSQNIKYPAIAEENGVEGRVLVTFVVERDGSIADVRVVKSVDPSLDEEAVRVVKSMPRWIPGKQKGETVRVKYTTPVTFRLQ